MVYPHDSRMPPICASREPSTNKPIIIKRGERGYYDCLLPSFDVDGFNKRHDVTADAAECMLVGSMFGWHVPGAYLPLDEKSR